VLVKGKEVNDLLSSLTNKFLNNLGIIHTWVFLSVEGGVGFVLLKAIEYRPFI